jgi:predicted transcriptional regulator
MEFRRTNSQRQVVRNWPFQSVRPSRSAAKHTIQKLKEHGTVQRIKSTGRPRTACTVLNMDSVFETYTQAPEKSLAKAAAELNMSQSSVIYRILNELKFKDYARVYVY